MSGIVGADRNAAQLSNNYMTLLVAQLRHQDPLSPMDNNQMASQLAQMSQLEQLESMNGSFQKVLASIQTTEAAAMIGRQVQYHFVDESTGDVVVRQGQVDGAEFRDGRVMLRVGDWLIASERVLSIE